MITKQILSVLQHPEQFSAWTLTMKYREIPNVVIFPILMDTFFRNIDNSKNPIKFSQPPANITFVLFHEKVKVDKDIAIDWCPEIYETMYGVPRSYHSCGQMGHSQWYLPKEKRDDYVDVGFAQDADTPSHPGDVTFTKEYYEDFLGKADYDKYSIAWDEEDTW